MRSVICASAGFVARRSGRFARSRSGATALIFGLAFVPSMFALGAAIDFSRATIAKSRLQAAADAAVLAAGSQPKLTRQAREEIARNKVMANLGARASQLGVTVAETEPAAGVYQVTVNASVKTSVMKLALVETISVSVTSEAKTTGGGSDPIEIALALDNTGSMRDDMPALKQAAKTLAQSAMSNGVNGKVRVSVVPYVAAVNPGLTDTSMIDTRASSIYSGSWFTYAWLARDKNCTPNWGGGGGGSGPGGGNSGDTSGDANDIIDMLNPFRRIAQELFGVSAAFAADVTPNTIPPLSLQNKTSPTTGRTFKVPAGFGLQQKDSGTGGCDWLVNPTVVSSYELFNRLLDSNGNVVKWKGCVEARATSAELAYMNANWGSGYATGTDYDTTDTPPTAGNALSLFVPYFWADEPDYSTTTWATVAPGKFVAGTGGFHNNYLADHAIPNTWGWTRDDWGNGRSILKYDGTTRAAIISETAPETYGPNAACPEPVTRLTNNQGTVISAIEAMNFWYNGGTVISEGLMWAWRTLSPEKPYADGAAYTDPKTKKVIVLMTDGVNGLAENGNASSANISDYSAYGYLGGPRLQWLNAISTYAGMQTFLDNRLKKACDNAKAKGIKIYTVMFNHNGFLSGEQQAHSANLLRYCASAPENAYLATDSSALENAFAQIAVSATATPLRITR